MAAIIGKVDVMQAAQKTFISSTYWTERIGPTAALATLRKHRKLKVGDHLVTIGRKIQEGWKTLSQKQGLNLEITGIPPLSHFSFKLEKDLAARAFFVQLMLEQGFLATNSFYSMYAHNTGHVEAYLEATDRAFAKISDAILNNDLENRLSGCPAVAGFKRFT
jgi:glutamate-1-semialdehyde 2,1-aminomutase